MKWMECRARDDHKVDVRPVATIPEWMTFSIVLRSLGGAMLRAGYRLRGTALANPKIQTS
jgi:hypothetical protein